MTRSSVLPLLALWSLVVAAAPLRAQSPWIKTNVRLERDNQVRTALHAAAERGRYLGPNATLALTLSADRISGESPEVARRETSFASVGLAGTLGFPTARVGIEAGAAALLGAPGGTEATGQVALHRDLGRAAALRMRAVRERYTSTVSSLDTLVLGRTLEVALDRSGAPGWAWQAVARRVDFGDANPVTTAYAWVLAPLSRSPTHALRVGYAAGWQDAAHSTWKASVAPSTGPYPQQVPGRYGPYYSPHDVATHSVLLDGALALGRAWMLVDGSVGVRATEIAPRLVQATPVATPQLTFFERSFTPYRAGVSLVVPADDRTSVTVAVGYDRSAFYRMGTVRLAFARSL